MKKNEYFFGTGRRKTSIAQVRVFAGTGKFLIRKDDSFVEMNKDAISKIKRPFEVLNLMGKFDVTVILSGGGVSSGFGAINLGISRALSKIDSEYEKMLKKEGMLTRDPREKERKKPGLKRARRAPQWQKR